MLKEIKSFDSIVRYFLAATFLMGLSNGMFDAVYNFYLEARGVDKASIGHLYAIAMMMMAAAVIPLIFASRKIPQKKLLILSSYIYALPFILLPFLNSVSLSAITLGFILSGMIALLSLGNSLTGSHIPAKKRTTLFSCFFIAYLGAAMSGSVLVSLVTLYSPYPPIRNYQYILIASFVSALVMIVFRIRSIKGIAEPKKDNLKLDISYDIEWKNFFFLFIASSLLGASITLIFRFVNILFNLAYRMDISEISLIMGGDKVVSIIGAIFAPLLVRKLSLKPTILCIGALTFVCIYIQSLQVSITIFILLYFLRLLLNYSLMPLLDTLAITGFHQDRTLISTSLRQLAFYLGSALSAVIYGDLLDKNNWQLTLVISAALALSGALFMATIKQKKHPN